MRSSRHRKAARSLLASGLHSSKSAGNHRANRAKKKRKKEEGEPKGVRTSYLFFCEDMREEIDTVSPAADLNLNLRGKKLG